MKAERNYPKYTITPKAEAAILRGHPWVYDAEITAGHGDDDFSTILLPGAQRTGE